MSKTPKKAEDIFRWGKVIESFLYDFNGTEVEFIKYYPWKQDENRLILSGTVNYKKILFSCPSLLESSPSLYYLIISWITRECLGEHEQFLTIGIAKSLGVYDESE